MVLGPTIKLLNKLKFYIYISVTWFQFLSLKLQMNLSSFFQKVFHAQIIIFFYNRKVLCYCITAIQRQR